MIAPPNSPIVNAGVLYVNGLELSWIDATHLQITAGAARDVTNTNDIILNETVILNGNVVGPNGFDQQPIQSQHAFAVFIIGDSTGQMPTAGLLSFVVDITNVRPYLPKGYDMFRRIAWSGTFFTPEFVQLEQFGIDEFRTYYYNLGFPFLSGGNSTTFVDAPVFTLPFATFPTEALLIVEFNAANATDKVEFLPFGATNPNGMVAFGAGVVGLQTATMWVPVRPDGVVATLQYKVSDAADSLQLTVTGFRDYL